MNNTITIKYANGSMEINLEAWTDYKPTKAEIRRVYKLAAESDRDYNTTVIDDVQTFIRVNGDSKSKVFKALAEVFGVSLGIKEAPKKATRKDFVYPQHKHIKYGVYILAIPAEIYTYKEIKYGIYKETGTDYKGFTLVEWSTGAKIDGSSDKNYLIQRIIDTYDRVVDGVNRMKNYVDRNAAIRGGQYTDIIGKSLNTVRELFKLNIITKDAYINTVSEFSKLTETETAA